MAPILDIYIWCESPFLTHVYMGNMHGFPYMGTFSLYK